MNKVYVVLEHWADWEGSGGTIVAVHADETAANCTAIDLQKERDDVDFLVEGWEVIK